MGTLPFSSLKGFGLSSASFYFVRLAPLSHKILQFDCAVVKLNLYHPKEESLAVGLNLS